MLAYESTIYLFIHNVARRHQALVRMVGFRMAGFMLSGSGIRVFVLGNKGLRWGGWGKVQVNDGEGGGVVGVRCGGGQGMWCVLSTGGA